MWEKKWDGVNRRRGDGANVTVDLCLICRCRNDKTASANLSAPSPCRPVTLLSPLASAHLRLSISTMSRSGAGRLKELSVCSRYSKIDRNRRQAVANAHQATSPCDLTRAAIRPPSFPSCLVGTLRRLSNAGCCERTIQLS